MIKFRVLYKEIKQDEFTLETIIELENSDLISAFVLAAWQFNREFPNKIFVAMYNIEEATTLTSMHIMGAILKDSPEIVI